MVQLRDDVVRPRRRDPLAARGLGGLRPPRQLHRPAGRLHGAATQRFRLDKLDDPDDVPELRGQGHASPRPAQFNLMFKTHAGPVEDAGAEVYLRPETAQGMFVNFANVLQTTRKKPPFGIAQVGKSFRNEITPGQLRLPHPRVRADGDGVLRPARRGARSGTSTGATSGCQWYLDLGMPEPRSCGCAPTTPTSCRTTRSGTSDVEFLFPWGWDELEGIANRGDYDLTQHAEHSGEKLDYFDQATNERYVPARDRAGRRRDPHDDGVPARRLRRGGGRGARPAPCCACTPASRPTRSPCCRCRRRTRCTPPAQRGAGRRSQPHFMCDYDETQAIGRRYRRQDELGTPLLRHRRLRLARRPRGHRPRARLDGAGPRPDRRPARPPPGAPRALNGCPGCGHPPWATSPRWLDRGLDYDVYEVRAAGSGG